MEAGTTTTTLTAKLPILNPAEYDLWLMRIEQYFLMTDYSLWEVIKNGNKVLKSTDGTVEQVYEPTSAEEKLDRKNEMKARGTLLMALPNKDQLKFHSYQDAKLLMEAIDKRYGGNKESKKVQRILLKQQYENFAATSSETLDKTFDRLQKLIGQLEIQGEVIGQEDMNLKLLRSLPSEWKTHALIWRNKAEIETISLDDFTNSTTETDNTASVVSAAHTQVNTVNSTSIDNLSDDVICAFLASQPNSPQLAKEDLEQIDPDDLEEMDLHWEMAMLTIRARRFIKRTGRNLDMNSQRIGFDMSKVECFNCHKNGHFARECRAPKTQEYRGREYVRKTVPVENTTENALIAQDGIGGQVNDKSKTGLGYNAVSSNAVSPEVERNFMPPKLDLIFIDEQVESEFVDTVSNEVNTVESNQETADKGVVETNTVRKNIFSPLIIEDWNSDDEVNDSTVWHKAVLSENRERGLLMFKASAAGFEKPNLLVYKILSRNIITLIAEEDTKSLWLDPKKEPNSLIYVAGNPQLEGKYKEKGVIDSVVLGT
ncbi:ribonuclease H-like domain-containing protein [Tanacetum coccineum]